MKHIAGSRRWGIILAGVLIAYLMLAYIILPALWRHHEHEPGLASLPMVTRTAAGIPGDALNVGLVGSKGDVLRAMHAAGWFPADPITLRTSIEIVGSVVLDLSALSILTEKRSSSRSNSRTAEAPTSDITFGSGRSWKREWMVARSGLVQLRSTAGWA
jgi:LssY C-terminus